MFGLEMFVVLFGEASVRSLRTLLDEIDILRVFWSPGTWGGQPGAEGLFAAQIWDPNSSWVVCIESWWYVVLDESSLHLDPLGGRR
jgi:hypothetical protein